MHLITWSPAPLRSADRHTTNIKQSKIHRVDTIRLVSLHRIHRICGAKQWFLNVKPLERYVPYYSIKLKSKKSIYIIISMKKLFNYIIFLGRLLNFVSGHLCTHVLSVSFTCSSHQPSYNECYRDKRVHTWYF